MDIEILEDNKLASKVEELHELRKEIKRLQELEAKAKEYLTSTGEESIDGFYCKAVISYFEETKTTDNAALVKFLNPPSQIIAKFQKKKAAYEVVNIRAL